MTDRPTRYLGLDPSTKHAGWGLIESAAAEAGRRGAPRYRYVACGVASAPERWPLPRRLARIAAQIAAVVEEHRPDHVGVELAFLSPKLSGNARTAIALGEARGALLCKLSELGVESITDYMPRAVKAAVTGNGAATKEEVARYVRASLEGGELIEAERSDPTDALAVALTLALLLNNPVNAVAKVKGLRLGRGRSGGRGRGRSRGERLVVVRRP